MYTCGPTVYDYAHIGNYRTFVISGYFAAFLKLRGFKLNHVMNLTGRRRTALSPTLLPLAWASATTPRDSCKRSSTIARRSASRPRSTGSGRTDHIDDMVKLIQRLQQKTFTYPGDGSIYYRIAKFPAYGKLSKIDLTGIQAGRARRQRSLRKRECARFCVVESAEAGRAFLGNSAWAGASRDGTLSVPQWP